MNLLKWQQRIAKGEDLHTKFKEWPINVNSLAATLVSFANGDSGQLMIGIRDDGHVIGVEDADTVMRMVDNAAYNNCLPPITITQEIITWPSDTEDKDEGNRNEGNKNEEDKDGDKNEPSQDRTIVVVNIPKGDQRPYCPNNGRYSIRTTSGRRQASRQELLRLFQAGDSLYYDETPLMRATIDDLNTNRVEQFFEEVQGTGWDALGLSLEQLLVNWKISHRQHDTLYPTLAGMFFFGKMPEFFVPYNYITAMRFPGLTLAEVPTDQKKITGSIDTMLEDAMRFLHIHLPIPHKIQAMEPEVKPELPLTALREALVNAVADRDYTIHSPIRLLIFDDRVEIHSPGMLPNSITLDALPLGVHVLRNPTIYNFLLRMGFVTDAGSGFPRLIAQVRAMTGKPPSWKLEGNEFVVAFPRQKDQD